MIAVLRYRFSTSGDTTRQGRVFRISLPNGGSSATRKTSPRVRSGRPTTPIPLGQTWWELVRPAGGPRLERGIAWRLLPSPHEACGWTGRSADRAPRPTPPRPIAGPDREGALGSVSPLSCQSEL